MPRLSPSFVPVAAAMCLQRCNACARCRFTRSRMRNWMTTYLIAASARFVGAFAALDNIRAAQERALVFVDDLTI